MGHATLHNNGSNSNVKIETMNAPVTENPKKALLAALHKVQALGDTPLRTQLDKAGKYYECNRQHLRQLPAAAHAPSPPTPRAAPASRISPCS